MTETDINTASKSYVAVMHNSGGYYLMLNRDDNNILTIRGWLKLSDALAWFTNAYNSNHDRGYESSMSACMNYIEFQPKILGFNGLQDMIDKLKLSKGSRVSSISSVSGSYTVLVLDPVLAEPLYNNGSSPELITEK